MAAGKSTVAQALAERLPKSAHVRGDVFRRMIVSEREEMEPPFTEEAVEQLNLRYRIAAQVAEMYCAAGFTAIYQDIILGAALQAVVDLLKAKRTTYGIVLCPVPNVVAEREAGRGKVGYVGWSPADLDKELRDNTPHLGLWLDTSALTVAQTVDAILARLDEAKL